MEVPDSDEGRVQLMKAFAEGWAEPFRGMVMGIDDGMGVKSLGVEDWVPRVGMWDNRGGRVTLVGYAGHAMTICAFSFPWLRCGFPTLSRRA